MAATAADPNATIHINFNPKVEEKSAEDAPEIHYMPCLIKADGPANVSKYFKIDDTGENGELKASFRGHPLCGKEIAVPPGYKGLVLQEMKKPSSDDMERTLHVTDVFHKFTYWNWDKTPTENDPFISALDWIDIAEALHAPIEVDENTNVTNVNN